MISDKDYYEMKRATDDMLQMAESHLGEIVSILKRLKAVRSEVKAVTTLEEVGKLKECNAGAGIIFTGAQGVMNAMFARDVTGATPADHIEYHMTKAIANLKDCYDPTREQVSDESK